MDKEKPKRKGYATAKARVEANQRYLNKNPENRKRANIATYKSVTKLYLSNYATEEVIKELKGIMKARLEELKRIKEQKKKEKLEKTI